MVVSKINELLVAAVGYAHDILHWRFQTGSSTFCDHLKCVLIYTISAATTKIITSDGPGCGDSRQRKAPARGLVRWINYSTRNVIECMCNLHIQCNGDVGIEVLDARVLVNELRPVEQRTSLTISISPGSTASQMAGPASIKVIQTCVIHQMMFC